MSHRHELTRSNGVKRSQWALDWCLHFAIERPDIGQRDPMLAVSRRQMVLL